MFAYYASNFNRRTETRTRPAATQLLSLARDLGCKLRSQRDATTLCTQCFENCVLSSAKMWHKYLRQFTCLAAARSLPLGHSCSCAIAPCQTPICECDGRAHVCTVCACDRIDAPIVAAAAVSCASAVSVWQDAHAVREEDISNMLPIACRAMRARGAFPKRAVMSVHMCMLARARTCCA